MTTAARVIPAVPSFSVDGGFLYAIPPALSPSVGTGSLVRVPLGGRRVAGYVVAVVETERADLKEIKAVSAPHSLFDGALLDTLTWAAHHYVAPMATVLEMTRPPNLPRVQRREPNRVEPGPDGGTAGRIGEEIALGRRRRPAAFLTRPEFTEWMGAMTRPSLAAGRSMMVIAPTAREVEALTGDAPPGSHPVVVTGDLTAAELTRAWERAATSPGSLIVGTPRIASWPVASLAGVVVVEEGRRAMKSRQTPTIAVREIIRRRSMREKIPAVFVGPTPSVALYGTGPEILTDGWGARFWPLVEVVDRTQEPPGEGVLSRRVQAAVRGAMAKGWHVLLFSHRRGYAPAYACVTCGTLRLCPVCGSRPEPGETCVRCGAPLEGCLSCGGRRFRPLGAGVERVRSEAARRFGADAVGDHGPVYVGSERDLVTVPQVDLAVVVDADGLIMGTSYRAAEESLRTMVRAAGKVRSGQGRRMMVQTARPEHRVITALRRGTPLEFLDEELSVRRELGFPPYSELLVIEVRPTDAHGSVDDSIRELAGAEVLVMGPALRPWGARWLLTAPSLSRFKEGLRPVVQHWRDDGVTVRVDADPLDV